MKTQQGVGMKEESFPTLSPEERVTNTVDVEVFSGSPEVAFNPPDFDSFSPPEYQSKILSESTVPVGKRSFTLTAEQLAILASDSLERVVSADAGTSKTTVLIKVLENDIKKGKRQENILVLTYNKGAAKVLRDRFTELEIDTSRLAITTIHAFCYKILQDNSLKTVSPSKPTILSEEQQSNILRNIALKMHLRLEDDLLKKIAGLISLARNSMTEIKAPPNLSGLSLFQLRNISAEYKKEKMRRNSIDYDDMLTMVYALLKEKSSLCSELTAQWKHVYVDEAQDTSRLQWEIVDTFRTETFVVGDPKQAIYGWRGGIGDFFSRFTGAEKFELHQNFRSTPQIVAVANAIYPTGLVTQNEAGPAPTLLSFADPLEEAAALGNIIDHLVHVKGIDPSQIAVVGRTNEQLWLIELALLNRKINICSKYELWRSQKKLQEFLYFYDWVSCSNSIHTWRAILTAMGVPKPETVKLPQQIDMFDGPDKYAFLPARARKLLNQLDKFDLFYFPPGEDIKLFYNNFFKKEFFKLPDKLIEKIAYVAKQWPNEFTMLRENKIWDVVDKKPGVLLSTIHGVKGEQFEYTFLIGLSEGIFPSGLSTDQSEEKNLFYVAVTRAKKQLCVSEVRQDLDQRSRQRSSFLETIDLSGFDLNQDTNLAQLSFEESRRKRLDRKY